MMRPAVDNSRAALGLIAIVVCVWLLGCTSASSGAVSAPESGGDVAQQTQSQGEAPGLAAVVTRVVDGDTIIVQVQDQTETVRLLGIDTPEKAGGPRPAECFGTEASARLGELLPLQTQILLSRDQESRDQYSRLLAFVHRADDGLFINLAMIEDGYATPLFFAPNRAAEQRFVAAGDTARRNWVGFWPACGAADVVIPS